MMEFMLSIAAMYTMMCAASLMRFFHCLFALSFALCLMLPPCSVVRHCVAALAACFEVLFIFFWRIWLSCVYVCLCAFEGVKHKCFWKFILHVLMHLSMQFVLRNGDNLVWLKNNGPPFHYYHSRKITHFRAVWILFVRRSCLTTRWEIA